MRIFFYLTTVQIRGHNGTNAESRSSSAVVAPAERQDVKLKQQQPAAEALLPETTEEPRAR